MLLAHLCRPSRLSLEERNRPRECVYAGGLTLVSRTAAVFEQSLGWAWMIARKGAVSSETNSASRMIYNLRLPSSPLPAPRSLEMCNWEPDFRLTGGRRPVKCALFIWNQNTSVVREQLFTPQPGEQSATWCASPVTEKEHPSIQSKAAERTTRNVRRISRPAVPELCMCTWTMRRSCRLTRKAGCELSKAASLFCAFIQPQVRRPETGSIAAGE